MSNKFRFSDDEINIKELIIALWGKKHIIVSFILIASIVAGLISVFLLPPVYKTKLNIVISMPETYSTKFGDYTLPITGNEQYIKFITSNDVILNTIKDMGYDLAEVPVELIKGSISIGITELRANTEQNSFEVTVSANSPQESLKLANSLFNNYIKFMDLMTKERAINYYINSFQIDIKTYENSVDRYRETLSKNEKLLTETPKTLSEDANLEISAKLNSDSNYTVPINTINPNYIRIEQDIVYNKQQINEFENSIRMAKQYLVELNFEKQLISEYYETGQTEVPKLDIVGVVDTNIYLPSTPIAPSKKSSPNNKINVFAGAAIGGVIGIMAAIIKEYWVVGKNK